MTNPSKAVIVKAVVKKDSQPTEQPKLTIKDTVHEFKTNRENTQKNQVIQTIKEKRLDQELEVFTEKKPKQQEENQQKKNQIVSVQAVQNLDTENLDRLLILLTNYSLEELENLNLQDLILKSYNFLLSSFYLYLVEYQKLSLLDSFAKEQEIDSKLSKTPKILINSLWKSLSKTEVFKNFLESLLKEISKQIHQPLLER